MFLNHQSPELRIRHNPIIMTMLGTEGQTGQGTNTQEITEWKEELLYM